MSIFLFNILVIIGSFQGILTSILLWLTPPRSVSRLILSCILLVFVLLSCKILLHSLGLWQNPYLRYFPLAFELAIQPLFYLYVCSLTVPGFRISRKELYHFIPASIFMIHAILVYAKVIGVDNLMLKDSQAESLYFNRVKTIEDFLMIVSSFLYWYLSYRKVSQYRKWLHKNISASDFPEYTWLRNILMLTIVLFSILALNLLLDFGFGFSKQYFLHWQLFFLYMSGLIYYLGFKGYHQPGYLLPVPVPDYNKEFPADQQTEPKQEVVYGVKELIEKALKDEKLYLDPELSLAGFAKHVGTSPAVLSATINTLYEKNFRNLINDYRVEEVKQKLNDPALSHLSILGIALESGFNSEASFYRIFKKYTSLSPKEYIEKQQKTP